MKYRISIVIPTKNRQYYCLEAVKQIISLNLESVQICIQDNSDDNSLQSLLAELHCEYLVYNYHQGVLSFVDNFSEAIELSNGDYICMIGDDDGILPYICNAVDYMQTNEVEVLVPTYNSIYFWPSNNPIVTNGTKGRLDLIAIDGQISYSKINEKEALNSLLDSGGQDYQSLNMPRLYHGIVKTEILGRIKSKVGTYFMGLTPDMFMSVALSLVSDRVYACNYPIAISGICPRSGSSDSATGKHTGELKDAPHFRGHSNYHWEELIPSFYSVETIWAETFLQTLRLFSRNDLLSKFNLRELEARCLKKFPQFKMLLKEHAKKNGLSWLSIVFVSKFKPLINKLYAKYKSIGKKKSVKQILTNVPNISVACDKTIEYLSLKFND